MTRRTRAVVVGGIVALSLASAWPAVAAATVTEFGDGISSGASPLRIAAGPDGNLWFTENGVNRIGRITPAGKITEFSNGITGTGLQGIAAGPDGNIWFTEFDRVGRITPSGSVTEFTAPITGRNLTAIAAGADGNLWFTEANGKNPYIGRITAAGTITEFNGGLTVTPDSIGPGPDGNVWFAASGLDKIGGVTPTGTITQVDTGIESGPGAIGAGPDGGVWFTRFDGIGRITPATLSPQAFTSGVTGHPAGGIAIGSDGNLWFTEPDGNRIGRITPAGVITEFPVLGRPAGIAAGPDGALWFTEPDGNRIGRITTDTGASISSGSASAGPTSASGTGDSAGQTQSAVATGVGASSSGGTAASCTVRIPTIQSNLRKRVLSTRVRCDRAAMVAETATLTLSARRKKGHKAAAKPVTLDATSAGVPAGQAVTLRLSVARSEGAALIRAIKQHRRYVVRVSATATTAEGISSSSLRTIRSLKLARVKRRR